MFNIIASPQLPCTTIKLVRRSWDDRLFSWPWDPFQPHRISKEPFVVKLGNFIHVHPDNAPYVERFLEKYNIPYKSGDKVFEPSKTQASMWK